MTNSKIISEALKTHGLTESQLQQLCKAAGGSLPFHTAAEWSRMGRHIKAGAAPLFAVRLWKYTDKPGLEAREAAEEAGEDAPELDGHFYKKLSYIYGPDQVEEDAPAADLETIRSRLEDLPGLTLTVKGAKTGAPVVWLTGDTTTHADAIKAVGGIWSNKRAAYWIRPGKASPAPAPTEDPAPATAQATPAPVAALPPAPVRPALPAPAPAVEAEKPHPQPWKKREFYTIGNKGGKPAARQVSGYTDSLFNYYKLNSRWYAIVPAYGLAVTNAGTRTEAQVEAVKMIDRLNASTQRDAARLQKFSDLIREAQAGDNEKLF